MPIMAEDRIADRSRAIEAALLNIEKRFGKGSIMRLGERDVSGSAGDIDDLAIARRGDWRGRRAARSHRRDLRPESSGKTTLALHMWPKRKEPAASLRISTPNMQWMPTTLPSSA
jgi:recombination protein RecA